MKREQGELREQHLKFLRVLGDLNRLDDSNLSSSMAIVKKLMNSQDKLYFGMEMLMNIICQVCTFKSVESVVESWISTLEHHSHNQRLLSEKNINMVMTIAINGPLCNTVSIWSKQVWTDIGNHLGTAIGIL